MIYLQLKAEFGRVAGDKDIVKEMTAKFENMATKDFGTCSTEKSCNSFVQRGRRHTFAGAR